MGTGFDSIVKEPLQVSWKKESEIDASLYPNQWIRTAV